MTGFEGFGLLFDIPTPFDRPEVLRAFIADFTATEELRSNPQVQNAVQLVRGYLAEQEANPILFGA